ncbi:MAG: bifunctional folylpolyglutamate synthase/dihydrofolate synthase [Cytophagales bacterium]|nr:bifunctional folylpolyglutamate synthase/dihydrofolate synthase [Cytophagales bacterium]MDW8383861.1 folylpolyglutamate synthase/dihydrofolate synthase family protein [Flammeovirgaceae bacterium]
MTYQEAEAFLYRSLPMYHRIGAPAYNASLDKILAFSQYLGNPHKQFSSIHIAGTNGKGSTSHTLAAILQCAEYKTGLYTSPHLVNFTERIRINGSEIEQDYIAAFITQHQSFLEKHKLSFFELTVGMAFQYFAEKKVDIAVIEVGMGGRLDATNIVEPLISLITNIGYDHMEFLGDTLPKIAYEKAGIIKKKTPVVISQTQQQEITNVFLQRAQECQSPIVFADTFIRCSQNNKKLVDIYKNNCLWLKNVKMDLLGKHQLANLQGVLAVVHELINLGYIINDKAIQKGIENVTTLTNLRGRWQKIGEHPLTFCDVGHNKDGIEVILNTLSDYSFKQLRVVFGMVKDKDHDSILAMLPQDACYYFCQPSVERRLDAADLFQKAQRYGLNGKVIPHPKDALNLARQEAHTEDLIWVGGSTFVVADVLK